MNKLLSEILIYVTMAAYAVVYQEIPSDPPPIPSKIPMGLLATPTKRMAQSRESPTLVIATLAGEQLCAVTTEPLNLRSGPGTNFPVIGVLPPGSIITILQNASGDWQQVVTRLGSGWVFIDYIQPTVCLPPSFSYFL